MDTNEINGNNFGSAYREAIQREKQLYQKERENEPTFEDALKRKKREVWADIIEV